MSTLFRICTVALLFASTLSAQDAIELVTSDSVHVFGDLYASDADDAATILLFHQAGANGPAEYEAIIPRLLEAEYSVVSIDQRSGGDRFGGSNRTVASADGQSTGYCEAMPDLESAVDYAVKRRPENPVIIWGSSYSAGLVIRLAAKRPGEVDAVLAFSPASGGPMQSCSPNDVAGEVTQPLLVLRPASEVTNESVAKQLALFESAGHQTYVAENGVHGSSMLDASRTKHSTDQTWATVMNFLEKVGQD
jgi:pimeloyl-ACP methyl ester carboxylesterase